MAAAAMDENSSKSEPSRAKGYEEHWQQPQPSADAPRLQLWNSLTRSKVDFVPVRDRHITWYNCGPTVYDASHMGHARNYVTQDVLRRIMRDYFGYNIHFVMNITDIDDKIIIRARQKHLYDEFEQQTEALSEQLIAQVQTAWDAYFIKFNKTLEPDPAKTGQPNANGNGDAPVMTWEVLSKRLKEDTEWLSAVKNVNEKFTMHLEALTASRNAIETARQHFASGSVSREHSTKLLQASTDVLGPWLDAQKGKIVTDPLIFRALAAYWEDDFMQDMSSLRVEPPTTLTRVSEFVPEIARYIQRIIDNGYAYATEDGSVYFDVGTYDGAKPAGKDWNHTYAKIRPWSKGNRRLLEEGEGSLSNERGKKSQSDFALWKASKAGEPSWDSPWGPGRPGWHIECSVMATHVLGDKMDIHSGGVDLAYPHHDNEIAQTEAHAECRQWVNYFLHTGHLHIEGLKMSKSLKNFITIKEALAKYTARQLRLMFIMQPWSGRMDFRESGMTEVKSIESTFNKFFTNVKALVLDAQHQRQAHRIQHQHEQLERDLLERLASAQTQFHINMCDSLNTPEALQAALDLVSATNVYINARQRGQLNVNAIQAISAWITRMLRMFGLGEGADSDALGQRVIGWGQIASGDQDGHTVDRDETLMPYLRILSRFRDEVRRLARDKADSSVILALSDRLRDEDLVDLGVALDDQEDGKALVKLVPADQLRAARDEKAAAAAKKAEQKAASQAAAEAKKREKLEKGRLAPSNMFRGSDEFSKFGDDGLPTHDKDGLEISKNRMKTLKKQYDAQEKLHAAFLANSGL